VWRTGRRLLLVLQTFVVYVLISIGLAVWNFDSLLRFLFSRSRRSPLRTGILADRVAIDNVISAVRTVTRYSYRDTLDCLPRSLCVYYLLRRRGVAVEFLLGVKTFPFAGHAWVEYDGCAIDELPSNVSRYAVLLRES
jgi:hypothetical protein